MDRFQAVARGSQWMMQAVKTAAQVPMQIPRRRGTIARRGGFCFRLCGLASGPSSVETGQAIHSISMPGHCPLSLPQSPSLFPSTVGGGREGSDRPPASRGERPTPILALSHPSVLTLRRPAGAKSLVGRGPVPHSLTSRSRAGVVLEPQIQFNQRS